MLDALIMLGRPMVCVLCLAGEEGGTVDSSGGVHHIFSRARLPGYRNKFLLWNRVNVAVSCQPHHERYDKQPEVWTQAMVKLGFAEPEDYAPYYKATNRG